MAKKYSRPRPKIPAQTERELWAKAAGRCEFRGCNRLLYKDSTTQQKSNLANISHIVAFSPEGPRGHPELSIKLEKDIDNLMLTCRDHAKIIDDKDKEEEYPIKLLQEFKKEHEKRIRLLTDIRDDAKTHVLIVQANINGDPVDINEKQAFKAVLPMYPANEHGYVVDLTDITLSEDKPDYWKFMELNLTDKVNDALRIGQRGKRPKHLSVFALAPIPLLVHLGTLLGDINTVELFQHHRDSRNWTWTKDDEPMHAYYEVHELQLVPDAEQVAIILSISGQVKIERVREVMGTEYSAYEIRACRPSLDFLKSQRRLELFGYEYRKLLEDIRGQYGSVCHLHLFAAIPPPVAVLCGQNLLPKSDPAMAVYEFHRTRGFTQALTVNEAKR